MSRQLFDAAGNGDLARVVDCVNRGADIAWQHKPTGRTALSAAAISGHLEVVRALVEHGADLNWQDSAVGFTPLGWACEGQHAAVVQFLLSKGADPNLPTHTFRITPLMSTALSGNVAIAQMLLEARVEINSATTDGRTALAMAQSRKHAELAHVLESAGGTLGVPPLSPARRSWPAIDESLVTVNYASPECVLRSFMLAMHEYELAAAALGRASVGQPTNQAILALMQAVFDRFCTPIERPFGRRGSYQRPPEYDPRREFLIGVHRVNSSRTELTTCDSAYKQEFFYVLLRKKGRWLLDSKQQRLVGGSWLKWHL